MAEQEHCAASLGLVRDALWTVWRIVAQHATGGRPQLPVKNLITVACCTELDHVLDAVTELQAALARTREEAAAAADVVAEPFAM